jgi:hypothetical protein
VKRLLVVAALLVASPSLADSNLPPAYWSNRQLPDAAKEAHNGRLLVLGIAPERVEWFAEQDPQDAA